MIKTDNNNDSNNDINNDNNNNSHFTRCCVIVNVMSYVNIVESAFWNQ